MVVHLTDKEVLKWGYVYYTEEMTIREISDKTGVSQVKLSGYMSSLIHNDNFDVEWCNKKLRKKWALSNAGKRVPIQRSENEFPLTSVPYSTNEEDYGIGYAWTRSKEKKYLQIINQRKC